MTSKGNQLALKIGWWAAVTLKPGTAPLRCYVGKIEALDDRGLRLATVDWITGDATNWDLFVPHNNIESALVATDQHHLAAFREPAARWQHAMNRETSELPT